MELRLTYHGKEVIVLIKTYIIIYRIYYTIIYNYNQLHIFSILQCSPVLFHEEAARSKVRFSLWPGLWHVLSTRQSGNCQEPNGTRKRGLSIERASWSGGRLWEGTASFGFVHWALIGKGIQFISIWHNLTWDYSDMSQVIFLLLRCLNDFDMSQQQTRWSWVYHVARLLQFLMPAKRSAWHMKATATRLLVTDRIILACQW